METKTIEERLSEYINFRTAGQIIGFTVPFILAYNSVSAASEESTRSIQQLPGMSEYVPSTFFKYAEYGLAVLEGITLHTLIIVGMCHTPLILLCKDDEIPSLPQFGYQIGKRLDGLIEPLGGENGNKNY